ncbi:hypothetical protein [Streptomyces sp. NPDC046853]|uniref:hypothetical protein n=1 Tax=unclassified Streptomyces TaxID=2593676 RepID=UPI0033F9DFF5
MGFLLAVVLFLPLGVFVLWNPAGRADAFKAALVGTGLSARAVNAIALSWALLGGLSLAALVLLLAV